MANKCANNIIKNIIPQTPSKVGVLQSITFSHTPDEARSVGLAKACIISKNLFCYRENKHQYCKSNRMRNLHSFIKEEFRQESVLLLWQWEKIEKKMADYRNHRRFSIKCLKHEVIPVSVKLETNIHTAKGLQIIRRQRNSYYMNALDQSTACLKFTCTRGIHTSIS